MKPGDLVSLDLRHLNEDRPAGTYKLSYGVILSVGYDPLKEDLKARKVLNVRWCDPWSVPGWMWTTKKDRLRGRREGTLTIAAHQVKLEV